MPYVDLTVTDREGVGGNGQPADPPAGDTHTRARAPAPTHVREAHPNPSRSVADLARLPEKLLRSVGRQRADGCIPWMGHITPDGYGGAHFTNQNKGNAHRVIYVYLYGPLPSSLSVDHLCCSREVCPGGRTCAHRRCVNPTHLEPKSPRENTLRGNAYSARNAHAQECVNGHPFSGDNVRYRRDGRRRECRICSMERSRAVRVRRRGDALQIQCKDRTACPQGHAYTPENTKISTKGQRSCRTCANNRDRARRARQRADRGAA